MEVNDKGYLQNGNKLVMVQVGKEVFLLKHWETVDARKLEVILDKYDVRLLKDSEYQAD